MEAEVGGGGEARLCSVKLVKESVFPWKTMENHGRFLRLGTFLLSKKKSLSIMWRQYIHDITVLIFCATKILLL